MPYFSVSDSNKLVVTNYKVMFSSFKKTPNFNKIKRYKAKLIINYSDPLVYFTVRDPYQKAISFYKDKFQKIPQNADLSQPFKWEKPQRVFFPLMGLCVKNNSNLEIQQALLNTSFDDYVGCWLTVTNWTSIFTPSTGFSTIPIILCSRIWALNKSGYRSIKWTGPRRWRPLLMQLVLTLLSVPTVRVKSRRHKISAARR